MPRPRDSALREGARTGILGGSFDPPHVGHAIVARDLLERLELERLLVIPAAAPPHRGVHLPAATRLALVRTLFEAVTGVEVSEIEHERPGPSFTIDTVEALRKRFPADAFVLVMGGDQLAVIDTWKDYERLLGLVQIAVMRRGGEEPTTPPGVSGIDYIVVDVTRVDVSASRVRQRLREGRSIRFLVPESIRHDIECAWAEHAQGATQPNEH